MTTNRTEAPTTMQVARLIEPGRFEMTSLPRPSPGPGQVLVRVEAVSICGSDLGAYLGRHPRIVAPAILGHEFAGVIEALGPNVSGVAVGDRGAVEPTVACRTCRFCLRGNENICPSYRVIGEDDTLPGAMSGLVAVAADHFHPLPEAVSFEEGALVQPLAIGLHAVRDRGRVSAGETVLIVGAGPIGLAILLAAKDAGARVLISDTLPYRLEQAVELGADRAIDASSEDVASIAREETEGYGVDAAFEAVGGTSDAAFATAYDATSRGGRVVVLGSFKAPTVPLRIGDMKYGEIEIRGSQAHPFSFRDVIAGIAAGRIPAARLITHRFPLSQVGEAFRLLEARDERVQKIVLLPDTPGGTT
jgi:threonine dehydrogenase-like Zn-dependent dehydrogenase